MKKVISTYKLEVAGGITGAVSGFMYWYFVGCASGSCAITSSPIISSIYGAILGALLFGTFNTKKQTTKKNETNN